MEKRDLAGEIVFELGRRGVVDFVGGLEEQMGATHIGRFVLVGGRASIVGGSVPGRQGRGNAKTQESGPLERAGRA